MGHCLVVYKTKYGSTKRYVDWIQEETDADIIEADKVTDDILRKYDIVVFGSPMYKIDFLIAPVIKEHWETIKDKMIIVFLSSSAEVTTVVPFWFYHASFPENMRKKMMFYPIGGCINRKILSSSDLDFVNNNNIEFLLKKMTKEMGKLPQEAYQKITDEYLNIMQLGKEDFDRVEKKYIRPVISKILERSGDIIDVCDVEELEL